jgi:flavin-dependent dehydrogenase
VTAVVETGDSVRVAVGGRQVTAHYLVGADGALSGVARSLGLRPQPRMGGTLELEVPLDGREDLQIAYGSRAIFSLGTLPGGYAWVFPKGDHLSVGVGRFRPGRVDLRGALQREMERLGIALGGLRPVGHPIPCYQARPWLLWRVRPQEKLSTLRCLLVGDAAGLVDPLLGEGIRYAIASARLAARAIAKDDLSGYERAIWKEIGHNLATAALTANLFYRWSRRCYQLGVRNPVIVRQFVDLLTERVSYQGIGRRLVAATAQMLLGGLSRTESVV